METAHDKVKVRNREKQLLNLPAWNVHKTKMIATAVLDQNEPQQSFAESYKKQL